MSQPQAKYLRLRTKWSNGSIGTTEFTDLRLNRVQNLLWSVNKEFDHGDLLDIILRANAQFPVPLFLEVGEPIPDGPLSLDRDDEIDYGEEEDNGTPRIVEADLVFSYEELPTETQARRILAHEAEDFPAPPREEIPGEPLEDLDR